MFTFGFYNSLNGDRKYDSTQMSSLFDGIIEDGIFGNVGEQFMVVPGTGMQVIVKTGRAWFKHTWNLNDSWMLLDIDPADTLRSRIDSVVLEVNSNLDVRENSIKIVKGAVAASPYPPVMIHGDGVDQYRLADITVDPAATYIGEANISIKVGQTETPFVVAPIKSVDISDLFREWNGQFQEWFSNIKAQLEGDIVTNLQKQIDERVKVEDKATSEDILNGTPGKWVDAENFKNGVSIGGVYSVGSIIRSVNNIEELSNGTFIQMDGRPVKYPSYEESPYYYKSSQIPYGIEVDTQYPVFAPAVSGEIGFYSYELYIPVKIDNKLYYISTNGSDYYIVCYNVDTNDYNAMKTTDVPTAIWALKHGIVFREGDYLSYVDKNMSHYQYNVYNLSRSVSSTGRAAAVVRYINDGSGMVIEYAYTLDSRTQFALAYTENGTEWHDINLDASNVLSTMSTDHHHSVPYIDIFKGTDYVLLDGPNGAKYIYNYKTGEMNYKFTVNSKITFLENGFLVITELESQRSIKINICKFNSSFNGYSTPYTITLPIMSYNITNATGDSASTYVKLILDDGDWYTIILSGKYQVIYSFKDGNRNAACACAICSLKIKKDYSEYRIENCKTFVPINDDTPWCTKDDLFYDTGLVRSFNQFNTNVGFVDSDTIIYLFPIAGSQCNASGYNIQTGEILRLDKQNKIFEITDIMQNFVYFKNTAIGFNATKLYRFDYNTYAATPISECDYIKVKDNDKL